MVRLYGGGTCKAQQGWGRIANNGASVLKMCTEDLVSVVVSMKVTMSFFFVCFLKQACHFSSLDPGTF